MKRDCYWKIEVELNGTWVTVGGRTQFNAAKAAAAKLYREMKGAHMTAIRGDDMCPLMRRTFESCFELV